MAAADVLIPSEVSTPHTPATTFPVEAGSTPEDPIVIKAEDNDLEPQEATMSRSSQSGSRKISFNVSDQYDIQDVVGEGAYGVVW